MHLEQLHGLADDGTTYAIALRQIALSWQERAHGQLAGHDAAQEVVSDFVGFSQGRSHRDLISQT